MRIPALRLLCLCLTAVPALARPDYARMSPTDFAARPAVKQTIELADFDAALLAAAIFHETNRVRLQLGLREFRAWDKLDTAAETQASIGALLRPPSHTNPFPMIATPMDRVKFAGVDPKFVAENIAVIPVQFAPSDIMVLALVNGKKEVRDGRTMEPLSNHTYASLAAAFVEAWMKSPGHRANIVEPKLRFLGCSAAATKSVEDVDMIYAVQVFCTPMRNPR